MREFREWAAYSAVEPFGGVRGDLQMAILADVVSQALGNKASKVSDYMPDFDRQSPHQSPSQMAEAFRVFAKKQNSRKG